MSTDTVEQARGIQWRAIQRRGTWILAGWFLVLLLAMALYGAADRFLQGLADAAFQRPLNAVVGVYVATWVLGGAWELIATALRGARRLAGSVPGSRPPDEGGITRP